MKINSILQPCRRNVYNLRSVRESQRPPLLAATLDYHSALRRRSRARALAKLAKAGRDMVFILLLLAYPIAFAAFILSNLWIALVAVVLVACGYMGEHYLRTRW